AKPDPAAPTWLTLLDPDNTAYGTLPPQLKDEMAALISQRQRILNGEAPDTVGWNERHATNTLKDVMSERLREINQYRQTEFSKYAAKQHEWDAWLTGELARGAVRDANIPNADPEMVRLLQAEKQFGAHN